MIILIHSSKTMRSAVEAGPRLRQPEMLKQAHTLATYLQTLSPMELARVMHLSPKLAETTHERIAQWTTAPTRQRVAIESFLGDIYSGLHVQSWSAEDTSYADSTLRILSGLYGILRPLDGIYPYRLEMGYKLPDAAYANLYGFWGNTIANTLPGDGSIINLAAKEYSKVIADFMDKDRIVTPQFLTVHPKTKQPTFVVVHAKIARGAFARWLIQEQADDASNVYKFTELGYVYDPVLSTLATPTFICRNFGGIGLSVRLT
jgi:cytoplasmic iron level regulating protein YaaA (DUF328/UPF0246 family)